MFDTESLGGQTNRHRNKAKVALPALECLAILTGMEALAIVVDLAMLAALVTTIP